jgi:hypothetical protein
MPWGYILFSGVNLQYGQAMVDVLRNNFKSIILQGIERFIPHRMLRKKMQTLTITIRK